MVVIAIVALLAAVAVPAYGKYVTNTRFSSVVPVIDGLVDRSIEFAQTNGRFGDAYDLGLAASAGSAHADSPSLLNQYLTAVSITDSGGDDCGRRGYLNAYIDRDLVGFSSDIVGPQPNHLGLECTFWHYEGVVYKECYYYYGTQSTSQTDSIVPGWFNVNTGTNWDFSNRNTYVYNLNSYINATCQ